MKNCIFNYKTASRYLNDFVVSRQKEDRNFSIRKWAKEMGFPSHSLLAMILQGKRNLTLRQVPYLSKGLNLSTPEKLFFQGLIQIENAKTKEEKDWCELWLSELRSPEQNTNSRKEIRELDEYEVLSNWIHTALLALSDTEFSFKNVDECRSYFSPSITLAEIRSSLDRLIVLKLIEKDSKGKYRATCARMTSKDDVKIRGGREYHKNVMKLGINAVDTQDILEREFQSMALAIPTSKVNLAKEMIRKFRTQFSEAMKSEHSNAVYQMNMQFFRLTEHPSKDVGLLTSMKVNEGVDVNNELEKK